MKWMVVLAYIDPGSGSLFFQMLIAGIMSITYFLRHVIFGFFTRLLGFFRRSKNEDYDA